MIKPVSHLVSKPNSKPKGRTKTARKPSQERALATVEAILEAAARILERDGLGAGFGTNRIAREAGVSIGSLYEYFDGRDAIVRALCERHMGNVRQLVDIMFEQLADAPTERALEVFLDALFALHEARPDLQRTLQLEFPQRFGLQPMIESDAYLESKLVDWLARRQPSVAREELETRAFVAIRAVRNVTIHAFAEGLSEQARGRVRATVERMALVTLEGLSPAFIRPPGSNAARLRPRSNARERLRSLARAGRSSRARREASSRRAHRNRAYEWGRGSAAPSHRKPS